MEMCLRVMPLHVMVWTDDKFLDSMLENLYIVEVVSFLNFLLLAAVARLKADNPLLGSSLIEYVSYAMAVFYYFESCPILLVYIVLENHLFLLFVEHMLTEF